MFLPLWGKTRETFYQSPPTKKIGKNNPKAAEIKADNATRQDWNRIADTALVSGIAEAKIIEIKNEHVYNEATRSMQKHGWLPGLFRGIIQKAKEILMGLIRETEVPPKPTLQVCGLQGVADSFEMKLQWVN